MSVTRQSDGFVVTRSLAVASWNAAGLAAAEARLRALQGFRSLTVNPRRRRLRLRYDAAVLGYGEIEAVLREAGLSPGQGIWQRGRSAWYRYLDANARDNAARGPQGCCSRPAGIYGPRSGPRGRR